VEILEPFPIRGLSYYSEAFSIIDSYASHSDDLEVKVESFREFEVHPVSYRDLKTSSEIKQINDEYE